MSEERLSDSDLLRLEIVNLSRKLAVANAERAMAEHNYAELSSKYFTLQLYNKYGLKEGDTIEPNGEIKRSASGS